MALEMYQSYFLKKSKSKYLMSSRMITCTKKLPINYMFFTEQKTDALQKRDLEDITSTN